MMTWLEWYNALDKPTWTPAPSTISLIWLILYPIIFVSFGFVFVQAFRGKVPWKIAVPFAINLVRQPLVHADLFGAEERAIGGGGHRDRLGNDHLVRGCGLEAFQVGRRGAGAILHLGVDCHGDSVVDHRDELGEPVISLGICCIFLPGDRVPVRGRQERADVVNIHGGDAFGDKEKARAMS